MMMRAAAVLVLLGVGLANALANLHNARRAGSPILTLVGDMSTWHRGCGAPLEMDIEQVAHSVAAHVHTSTRAEGLAQDALDAARPTPY